MTERRADKDAVSRRRVLKGTAALGLTLCAAPRANAAPEPIVITPALTDAARREGKIVWYAALDLPISEAIARAFETKFPGIACRVERSGAERIFQRIGQEQASGIHAVDAVESADAAHFIRWKREGWLASAVPEDVARYYPAEHKDPDGQFATWRIWFNLIGYNTKLVKAEDAPQSYADLLDPKWAGKIVKAHPGYSGATLTATFEIVRELGWPYFEKLAKQRVMQVQSSNDSPKKVALGERAVMADGNEHALFRLKESGQPIEAIYPREGTPLVTGPVGLFKSAPNPNAARLFCAWMFTAEAQQLLVDKGALRSAHPHVKERPGRKTLDEIRAMKDDPAGVEAQGDAIKARYAALFRV